MHIPRLAVCDTLQGQADSASVQSSLAEQLYLTKLKSSLIM